MRQAMQDLSIKALDPGTLAVPAELLESLQQAKRVLIVGHVPPDGDCVGSALGLRQALQALGKQAEVCVDDALPGNLRAFDPDHQVKRFDQLKPDPAGYDLICVVDVAQSSRVGRARKLLAKADRVAVIDHHNAPINHEVLGLKDSAKLNFFKESKADAATLMVAAVIAQLPGADQISDADRVAIDQPLMVGALTDTGQFSYNGISMTALRMFKYLLKADPVNTLDSLQAGLEYHLPDAGRGLLELSPQLKGALQNKTKQWSPKIHALVDKGQQVRERELGDGMLITSCPAAILDLATQAAQLSDPQAGINDVKAAMQSRIDQRRPDYDVTALLYEQNGGVAVSLRSDEAGPALALAEALGGGGHPRAAGAFVSGQSLSEVEATIAAWQAQRNLEKQVKLWTPGNL